MGTPCLGKTCFVNHKIYCCFQICEISFPHNYPSRTWVCFMSMKSVQYMRLVTKLVMQASDLEWKGRLMCHVMLQHNGGCFQHPPHYQLNLRGGADKTFWLHKENNKLRD
jgi:hypothetical protein